MGAETVHSTTTKRAVTILSGLGDISTDEIGIALEGGDRRMDGVIVSRAKLIRALEKALDVKIVAHPVKARP